MSTTVTLLTIDMTKISFPIVGLSIVLLLLALAIAKDTLLAQSQSGRVQLPVHDVVNLLLPATGFVFVYLVIIRVAELWNWLG